MLHSESDANRPNLVLVLSKSLKEHRRKEMRDINMKRDKIIKTSMTVQMTRFIE
jgi:hypothetical protein